MSGDASAQDTSGQAKLVVWTDGIALDAEFVAISATEEAESRDGLSDLESSALADAENTMAAVRGF